MGDPAERAKVVAAVAVAGGPLLDPHPDWVIRP
jgi:hypothetical protein